VVGGEGGELAVIRAGGGRAQGSGLRAQGEIMRFEDLDVWKKSAQLACEIFKATADLKDWGFRDQITRSALSISSNIAEGFERDSHRECARFLSFAKGSSGELRSQLYIAQDIGYLSKEQVKTWVADCTSISKMLSALIRKRREYADEVLEQQTDYEPEDLS
jgi:four helix bundle protein